MDNVRTLFEAVGGRQDDVDAQQWRASVVSRLFGTQPDPVRVDRYTILERLGSGGAGTVFAAWDPKLERRIALKLLHRGGDEDARSALDREAKLLAQLNHPNVVAVYDVSIHQGQPTLAMEYVDGPTVGEWVQASDRPWVDIVDAFAQAARGLAAAHASGIIHGDFKPGNMLVGAPDPSARRSVGRVRVSDFGIARVIEDRATPVFGTPLYTAPELFDRGHPDVASDSFAFFAALYECLYGRPAFEGSTRTEVVDNIRRGRRVPPPRGAAPRWLEDLVVSGLNPDPFRRPDDFVRVAARLERRGTPTRRWGAVLGIVATTAAIAPLVLGADAQADDCRDTLADLQASWNPQARERIAQHWADHGRPGAEDAWVRVAQGLDAYVTEFGRTTAGVCDADLEPEAKLQGELCLRWRQQDFEALTAELGTADGDAIDQAGLALQALRSPTSCLPTGDDATPQVESGPVVRQHVQRLVSRARALRGLGRADEARGHLDRALSLAQSSNATRLQAEVLLELGRERAFRLGITDDSPTEMTLEAARQAAASIGDRQLEARASLELADAYLRSARFDKAGGWLDHAEKEMGAFRDPVDRGRVELLRGMLLAFDGRMDDALVHTRSALALLEGRPSGAPWLGRAFNQFGELRFDRGEYSEAQALYERGLAVWMEALGPSHPHVADLHGNLGEAVLLAGDYDGAVDHFSRALAIRAAAYGDDSFVVAHTQAHLGDALRLAGRLDAAAAAYRHTLDSASQLRSQMARQLEGRMAFLDLDMGLDQVEPWAHNGLALLALQRGDSEAAVEHARAAPRVPLKGGRHPDLAARRDVLGLALAANGQHEEAREILERAEAEVTTAFGTDCVKSSYIPFALGRVLAHMGEDEEAARAFGRARAIQERDEAATGQLAATLAALAHLGGQR